MVQCLIEENDLYYPVKPFFDIAHNNKCYQVKNYLETLIKKYSDQFHEAVKNIDLETINKLITGNHIKLYTHCYNPGKLCNDQITLFFLVKEYCIDINS